MTLTPTASTRGERSPNPDQSRSSVPWKTHEKCDRCPRNLREESQAKKCKASATS